MRRLDEMGLRLNPDEIAACRRDLEKAKPYTLEESLADHADFPEERHCATRAMLLLQYAGLWTEEDEKKAFG